MKLHFPKTEPFPGVAPDDWNSWTWQFKNGLSTAQDMSRRFQLTADETAALNRGPSFQVRSTPYYAALASPTDSQEAIRQMILPRLEEFSLRGQQVSDPLGERKHSPRERLIHRYPDRVLFLVTDQCSVYCRYCLRKHFTAQDQAFVGSQDYLAALQYLRQATGVREVILSGGDPLTLADGRLERVLSDLRAIEHVEIIRIGSRMPVVSPMRITEDLARLLRRYKPVYFMTHFNHPRELSFEAAVGLERLVDHGVPVFNQMVFLNGINNHVAIVQALARRLVYLRVKPYYMFQCDPSEGTEHFRTSVQESMRIQAEMWGKLSGLAMANLSLDIPGGGGKVGLVPDFMTAHSDSVRHYQGWDGVQGVYQDPDPASSRQPSDVSLYLDEWETLSNQSYGRS